LAKTTTKIVGKSLPFTQNKCNGYIITIVTSY
jgi:hypothetical protein